MTEKKLTGNEMFEMVKEECERSLGKVGSRGKKKGVMYFGGGKGWVKYVDKKDLWQYWKYEGEIKNGKPHGEGTWKSSLWIYVGEFEDGYMSGQGTKYTSDGSRINYKGGMSGNNEHGKGIKYYDDGEKLIGQFKHGHLHNGIWYDKNGKIKYKVVNGKDIKP